MSREERLTNLLVSLFSEPELRRWLIRFKAPGGLDPWAEMPRGGSLITLAFEAVELLQRRGQIDKECFKSLEDIAPNRRVDIQTVAAEWGFSLPSPTTAPADPFSRVPRWIIQARTTSTFKVLCSAGFAAVLIAVLLRLAEPSPLGSPPFSVATIAVGFVAVPLVLYLLIPHLYLYAALRAASYRSPLLGSVLRHFEKGHAVDFSTVQPITRAVRQKALTPNQVAHFFLLVACRFPGTPRRLVAERSVFLFDEYGAGSEVVELCARPGAMSKRDREWIGSMMPDVESDEAVRRCHRWLTTEFRDGSSYHALLSRHLDTVTKLCYDEMLAYLIGEDAGPGDRRLECVILLIEKSAAPELFLTCIRRWVATDRILGCIDEFYDVLDEILREPEKAPCKPIIDFTMKHIRERLRNKDGRPVGMKYLLSALDREFGGASALKRMLASINTARWTPDESALFSAIGVALDALIAAQTYPNNTQLESDFEAARNRVWVLSNDKRAKLDFSEESEDSGSHPQAPA